MSRRPRAPAAVMAPAAFPLRRATIALVLLAIAVSLVSSGAVRAEPPPKVTHVEKKDAAEPPVAVRPDVIEVNGQQLITVELPHSGEARGHEARRLLDVTADGARLAVADEVGGHGTAALTIRQPDGSLVLRDLPGVLAAAFSPDGAALAALDGHGRLFRLDASSGEGDPVLDGPFSGALTFEEHGTLLALAVSSVEAPFQSRLVRIDLASGSTTPLTGDELVFSARPLEDGSVAYVAHRPGGALSVNRIGADGSVSQLAALERAAVNVAVSPDGRRFAYEIAGRGTFLVDSPSASPTHLADGRAPVFSPDGSKVLLHRGDTSVVVALDGSVVAEAPEPATAWLECGDEECAP
jgi:DNA-binding beta-propeller fold protein YncE